MKDEDNRRLKEVIKMAYTLKWITPTRKGMSYPEMQLSEVEKCMIAMWDDNEFNKMREWYNQEMTKQKAEELSGGKGK